MPRNVFANTVGVSLKVAVVNIVLVANALIWYFYAFEFLLNTVTAAHYSVPNKLAVFGADFLGIAATALFGSILIYKFGRRIHFLLYWMLSGVLLSLIPVTVDITAFPLLVVFSTLVGAYFGLGMPICMGYFAASTEAGNRARLGGLTFLCVFLGYFLLGSIGIEGIVLNAIALALFKLGGFVVLSFLKPEEKYANKRDQLAYGSIFQHRAFLLYFVPWLMFAVVNYTAVPIVNKIFPHNFVELSVIIENVTAGVFAVVLGFFADFIGRKRLILTGFSLLGVGYACLGLFVGNIYGGWFYTIADGVAWGAFYTIFIMTIWGDLAHEKSSEKYYVIGSLPFLFSNFMRLSISTYIEEISVSAVFSFASFFLFLAVLPLMYAPETLPEKNIRDRELKIYVEKAQKIREKYS
ncbi:MFS transporter [Candidatus Bathyarchaeota archaeon A05DMB-2]|jgi:MFS family permease|nr:MFS transporter [Candidatus Bathyarchaeota archaeon A05DMB-2]